MQSIGSQLRIFFVLIFVLLAGCSGMRSKQVSEEQRQARTRNTPPLIKTVELAIPKAQLKTALEQDVLTERLRVVAIFRAEDGTQPFYRLFDVSPNSVYKLLGLQNADVLVAANERYIANPNVFKQYVRLLPQEDKAQIEILRGTEAILLKYSFVE